MDSSSTDVMGEYTDCGALRAQGLRQGLRQPGGYKPSLSQNSTRNNIVDHQGACRVNKDNPMCSRGPVRTATPSDVQRVYGAIITGQLKSIRSQENAYKNRQDAEKRTYQAVCSRLTRRPRSHVIAANGAVLEQAKGTNQ